MGDSLLNSSGETTLLYRVEFVCRGNVCRSPYAEALAQAAGVPGVEFSSSGIQAMTGWGVDGLMAAELARRGIPTAHAARS